MYTPWIPHYKCPSVTSTKVWLIWPLDFDQWGWVKYCPLNRGIEIPTFTPIKWKWSHTKIKKVLTHDHARIHLSWSTSCWMSNHWATVSSASIFWTPGRIHQSGSFHHAPHPAMISIFFSYSQLQILSAHTTNPFWLQTSFTVTGNTCISFSELSRYFN